MSNLLYVYIASGIFFLLVEMLTATFYGLSVSLACFLLAAYVYITWDIYITVLQGLIFVLVSAISAYALPKWLIPKTEALRSGIEAHIGESFRLELVGADWKVKLDGVDYLVSDDCVTVDFTVGKKVRLDAQKSGTLVVSLLK